MKKRVCATCDILYYSETAIELKGKEFCSDKCLKEYYLNRIKELESSIKSWKDAWFDMRERFGKLAYRYQIPYSYKKGCVLSEEELKEKENEELIARIKMAEVDSDKATAVVEQHYGSLDEECHCKCHMPGIKMMHFMPCCNICNNCGLNIKLISYKKHCKSCIKSSELFDLLDSNIDEEEE